jgi:hypothetical protein
MRMRAMIRCFSLKEYFPADLADNDADLRRAVLCLSDIFFRQSGPIRCTYVRSHMTHSYALAEAIIPSLLP